MDSPFGTRDLELGPDPTTVGEVLVMRPGGLAEMVRAIPALRHLRGLYPVARITLLASSGALEIVRGCPYVDGFLDLSRAAAASLARYDVAISFANPGEMGEDGRRRASALLGRFPSLADVNARFLVQYRDPAQPQAFPINPVWPDRMCDSARMLRLVWLLGGEHPRSALSLWPTLAERNGAARLTQGVARPIGLVHPFARSDQRRWPLEHYAHLVDALSALGIEPVIVGVQEDRQHLPALAACVQGPFVDLVGATPVGVLAGLMERAAMFVGNDSGPAMLACALGLPSVVIGPASTIEQTGAAGSVTFVTAGPCAQCGEVACSHGLQPAASVPLEAVLSSVVTAAHQARRRWGSELVG